MKDFGSYPDNNSPYKKGESLDDIIQALESCYYPRLSTKESIEFPSDCPLFATLCIYLLISQLIHIDIKMQSLKLLNANIFLQKSKLKLIFQATIQ